MRLAQLCRCYLQMWSEATMSPASLLLGFLVGASFGFTFAIWLAGRRRSRGVACLIKRLEQIGEDDD